MYDNIFPVIDLVATGDNIRRLRISRGLSVRQLQGFFGFEEPRAIYKWQKGESLPTVDNLYALGKILDVPMEQILIPVNNSKEQQVPACCSNFLSGCSGYGKRLKNFRHFFCLLCSERSRSLALSAANRKKIKLIFAGIRREKEMEK